MRNLKVMHRLFYLPMREESWISSEFVMQIFPNIEEMIELHCNYSHFVTLYLPYSILNFYKIDSSFTFWLSNYVINSKLYFISIIFIIKLSFHMNMISRDLVSVLEGSLNNAFKDKKSENPVVGDLAEILEKRVGVISSFLYHTCEKCFVWLNNCLIHFEFILGKFQFFGNDGEKFKLAAAKFCQHQSLALETLRIKQRKDQKLANFLQVILQFMKYFTAKVNN